MNRGSELILIPIAALLWKHDYTRKKVFQGLFEVSAQKRGFRLIHREERVDGTRLGHLNRLNLSKMIRQQSSDYLRLKQKQWEREKAESENRQEWFPFGENLTPGGGSPLRKFAPKEQKNTPEPMEPEKQQAEHKPEPPTPHYQYPLAYPLPYQFAPYHQMMMMTSSEPPQTTTNANEGSTTLRNSASQFFAPQYQVIPAGAIPVSTINIDPSQICPVDQMGMWTMPPPTGPNGMRYGIPIPAPFVPQIMTSSSATSSAVINAMMTSASATTDSSSESGVSGVKDDVGDERKETQRSTEERQSTSDYTDDEPILMSRRSTVSTGTLQYNYEEQIAERRRFEEEQRRRERMEIEEAERQRRLLEERRDSEEQRRIQADRGRIEEERRRAAQFAAAMEKAEREAKLLKRAKVFKHVLSGAEEGQELEQIEQKLLGVDVETGKRLLKEVSDVEWHKRQDQVEIEKKAPGSAEKSLTRTRSMSISSPSPSSPFSRNSTGRRSVRMTSREKQEKQENDRPIPAAIQAADQPVPRHQEELRQRAAKTISPTTEEMLKSAGFYCPINREPANYRPSPPTKFDHHHHQRSAQNDITQSALFGPIATRTSIRRGQMRGTGLASPASVRMPAPKERTTSFEESSSGGEDGGSISPDLNHKHFESPLPSSTENVHPAPNSPPISKTEMNGEYEFNKPFRTRSALGSPMSMLNGSDSPSRCSSPSTSRLLQRLEQKGTVRREDEFISADVRRLAESNLSRSPSMASLRGSLQNLSIRGSQLNLAKKSGEPSPNLSKFASINSPARQSLSSLRKTTDRQNAALERLGRLRESLHAGKNYTPPRGMTSRVAPLSPRPST